jgi:RimJ/RimL family protein N-acetyltransferase
VLDWSAEVTGARRARGSAHLETPIAGWRGAADVALRSPAMDFAIEWLDLVAREPSPGEVERHAPALAVAYNHPANASLMGHTQAIAAEEIVEHYADMAARGAHPFLLFCDDVFVGDADLRGIRDGAAEFAFMIAVPSTQGKGLGTRFALMVHAFGFLQLGLDRIYASVIPENVASRRVFEKLGYTADDSPAARASADEPGDVTLVIDRATFEIRNAQALAQLRITRHDRGT